MMLLLAKDVSPTDLVSAVVSVFALCGSIYSIYLARKSDARSSAVQAKALDLQTPSTALQEKGHEYEKLRLQADFNTKVQELTYLITQHELLGARFEQTNRSAEAMIEKLPSELRLPEVEVLRAQLTEARNTDEAMGRGCIAAKELLKEIWALEGVSTHPPILQNVQQMTSLLSSGLASRQQFEDDAKKRLDVTKAELAKYPGQRVPEAD